LDSNDKNTKMHSNNNRPLSRKLKKHHALLRVLTYHRVAEIETPVILDPAMISATPGDFARQMQYLSNNYNVISMKDLIATAETSADLPERPVLITFDDAYHDFIEYAWPVLKRLRLPATVFVSTAYAAKPEEPFWWDKISNAFWNTSREKIDMAPLGPLMLTNTAERRKNLKKVKNYLKTLDHNIAMSRVDELYSYLKGNRMEIKVSLDWDELRQLHSQGITLCAHTRTHPILSRISAEDARKEIIGSQKDLEREIGDVLPIFCYPNGDYNDLIIQILKDAGFIMAFSTKDGHNDLDCINPFCLHRTNLTLRTSMLIFQLRLLKFGGIIDSLRHKSFITA
jgi:peptidoglycan/xylan/chitin deacetylase (PgdA/CDA1 family)